MAKLVIPFRDVGDEIHLAVALSMALREANKLAKYSKDANERRTARNSAATYKEIAKAAKEQGYGAFASEILENTEAPATRPTEPLVFKFDVSDPGDSTAGYSPYTENITVTVESGDLGPNGMNKEFAEAMQKFLTDWYDVAKVTLNKITP